MSFWSSCIHSSPAPRPARARHYGGLLRPDCLGRRLDKRNFRSKIALLGILNPLREWQKTGRKPAQLYRIAAGRFEKLKDKGILFPF